MISGEITLDHESMFLVDEENSDWKWKLGFRRKLADHEWATNSFELLSSLKGTVAIECYETEHYSASSTYLTAIVDAEQFFQMRDFSKCTETDCPDTLALPIRNYFSYNDGQTFGIRTYFQINIVTSLDLKRSMSF